MAKVAELYEDVEEFVNLLNDANTNAGSEWEMEFIASIYKQWDKWQEGMFLTEKQQARLEKMAQRGD